jgi:DNA-binding MarR family transcriptional regulator
LREVDIADRRNVWYSLTKKGIVLAEKTMSHLRDKIAEVFIGLSRDDETRLTNAVSMINAILLTLKTNYEG